MKSGLFLLSSIVLSWGDSGHAMTGKLGQALLDSQTSNFDKGFSYLGDFANWADEIKKTHHEYDWAKNLHYVDVEDEPLEKKCGFKLPGDLTKGIPILKRLSRSTMRNRSHFQLYTSL